MLEGLAADSTTPSAAPPDGSRVGFLVKMHHALADGVAAAALLANVMDPDPGAELSPPDAAVASRPGALAAGSSSRPRSATASPGSDGCPP